MKKLSKRFSGLFLALVMILAMLPTGALAAGDAIAEVNGTPYTAEQFAEAIAAAKNGGTVKLLDDYTLDLGTSRLDLSEYDITFDLNGKTLTLNSQGTDNGRQIAVYASNADLTITNGTLAGSSYGHLIYATNGSTLTMSDLTINYTGLGSSCMAISGSADATYEGVAINATDAGCVETMDTATFTDCTFTVTTENSGFSYTAVAVSFGGTYTAPYALYVYSSGGTIDVKGGSFTGSTAVMRADTSSSAQRIP